MRIAIIHCADCGKELNRSIPFEKQDEAKVRMTSGFAAGPCPEGCRSTFSDLNINTRVKIVELEEPKQSAEGAHE